MNTYHYTEDSYEQTILDLFKEMGYDYRYGPELEQETARDLEDASISCITRKQLLVINGATKQLAIEEAMRQLHAIQNEPLLSANIKMTEWLQQGLDVSYRANDGQIRCDHLKLIDQDNIDNNVFTVVNQWTIVNGTNTKRADIVVFINGLPIAVVELKSPTREVTNSEEAWLQLQNYMRRVPQLFTACQLCVISDMADT